MWHIERQNSAPCPCRKSNPPWLGLPQFAIIFYTLEIVRISRQIVCIVYLCSPLGSSTIGVRIGVEPMVGRRVLARLTVKAAANLKRPGRHADGCGLYLIVTKAGTKNYAFLYCREGQSHELGLGSVVTTTLADARQKAAQCRALLAQGLDPLEARQSGAEARKKRRTFGGLCR
jgi:hypothetical protein